MLVRALCGLAKLGARLPLCKLGVSRPCQQAMFSMESRPALDYFAECSFSFWLLKFVFSCAHALNPKISINLTRSILSVANSDFNFSAVNGICPRRYFNLSSTRVSAVWFCIVKMFGERTTAPFDGLASLAWSRYFCHSPTRANSERGKNFFSLR